LTRRLPTRRLPTRRQPGGSQSVVRTTARPRRRPRLRGPHLRGPRPASLATAPALPRSGPKCRLRPRAASARRRGPAPVFSALLSLSTRRCRLGRPATSPRSSAGEPSLGGGGPPALRNARCSLYLCTRSGRPAGSQTRTTHTSRRKPSRAARHTQLRLATWAAFATWALAELAGFGGGRRRFRIDPRRRRQSEDLTSRIRNSGSSWPSRHKNDQIVSALPNLKRTVATVAYSDD
jgi:hypothetical protein